MRQKEYVFIGDYNKPEAVVYVVESYDEEYIVYKRKDGMPITSYKKTDKMSTHKFGNTFTVKK